MKIKFSIDADLFKGLINAMSLVKDDFRVHFDESGMSTSSADAANVMFGDFRLPAVDFTSYDVEKTDIGIDIKDLADSLSMVSKGDQLNCHVENNQLVISFGNVRTTSRLVALSEITTGSCPNLTGDVVFEIPAKTFRDSVKYGEKGGPHLELSVNDGEVKMMANETKKIEIIGSDANIIKDGTATALFSTDYLKDIAKAIVSNIVSIEFRTNFPLIVNSDIGTAGRMRFLLAPRIESD